MCPAHYIAVALGPRLSGKHWGPLSPEELQDTALWCQCSHNTWQPPKAPTTTRTVPPEKEAVSSAATPGEQENRKFCKLKAEARVGGPGSRGMEGGAQMEVVGLRGRRTGTGERRRGPAGSHGSEGGYSGTKERRGLAGSRGPERYPDTGRIQRRSPSGSLR